MIRYFIGNDFTIGESEDLKVTTRVTVKDRVFLDIKETLGNHVLRINVYLEDGSVVKDAYYLNVSGDIRLQNENLLFDGRFNIV